MLGKLFKYAMKALSRTLVPLHVAVLVLGLVSCVAGFAGHTVGESGSSPERNVFMAVMTLAFLLSMVALFVAVVATFVIVIARFYRNLFTDEGYLTLTLPVNANQIMLSKTLAGLLWMCIDVVVVSLCAVLASLGAYGFVEGTLDSTVPYWMLSAAGGDLFGSEGWGSVLVGMANTGAQLVFGLLLAYLSFTLGARMAERHKVAAGIGIYVLLGWILGLVGGIGAIVASSATIYWGSVTFDYDVFTFFMSAASWVLLLGGAAICYALCVHLLKRRIELT